MYRKIGAINSFGEIPWGKEIIITGTVGRGWFFQMKGIFCRDNSNYRFVDDFGMSTYFATNEFFGVNVLEKVSTTRKPEEDAKWKD